MSAAAEQCRVTLTQLFAACGARAMSGAHEHLVRLCQLLRSTGAPGNEALAELINDCILRGKSALWQRLIVEFGVGLSAEFGAGMQVPTLDAVDQQKLMAEAIAVHRKTVTWIYKVGLALDMTFADDEQYNEWRAAEDEFHQRLERLRSRSGMEVLSESLGV